MGERLMTQFIAEHPYLFSFLCVIAVMYGADVLVAWANAWAYRKEQRKEGAD